jgi:hypothetical protein
MLRLNALALLVAAPQLVPLDEADARGRSGAGRPKAAKSTARRAARAIGEAGSGFAYYPNCTAAGAAPVRSGDPGYSRKLDGDGDGVGCK